MTFRLALLSCIAWIGVTSPLVFAAPAATQPVVTNKTRFRIPFRFDAAALERMNARELRLYVSSDGGAAWELTQTIGVDSGRFEFQAPGDGEYRFAVKTLDARNQLHPPGDVFETGLIVLVDSTPPELTLDVKQAAAGKVELHWRALDQNLDPTTLRLEYTQPGVDDWQGVSVAPRSAGQTAWSVPQGGIVAVRGSISDLAGNEKLTEVRSRIEPAGATNGPPRKPDLRQPIAETPVIAPEQSPLKDHFTQIVPQQAPLTARMPAETAVQSQLPVVERQPILFTQQPAHMVNDQPTLRPEIAQDRWLDTRQEASGERQESQISRDTQRSAPLRVAANYRLVKLPQFQIGYQIDDVGPSGLGSVELFVTQDQGRKWWKYGEDPDRQSPFDVVVPGDGEYGFAIRARSGVGLADDPPVQGKAPAVVVVVDQTPPTVELLPIRQGTGAQVNKLQLRWTITESHPAETPVALFFSANPNGPWETISTWCADTGEYVWTVGPGAPSQIYFRIAVRDAAGNLAEQQTPRPVIVDLSRPSARIVDIETPQATGPQ